MNHESNSPAAAHSGALRFPTRKRLLLVAASLLLAYAIALLTFMIRWMHFWMRGPYFLSYLGVFLAVFGLLLLWWTSRHDTGTLPALSTVAYAMVGGYVAGLIAMMLYPLFHENGVQRVVDALRFPTVESLVAFFWFPIRLATWLFGGITGGVMVLLSRRWRRMRQV